MAYQGGYRGTSEYPAEIRESCSSTLGGVFRQAVNCPAVPLTLWSVPDSRLPVGWPETRTGCAISMNTIPRGFSMIIVFFIGRSVAAGDDDVILRDPLMFYIKNPDYHSS